jgi:hypothetical protein
MRRSSIPGSGWSPEFTPHGLLDSSDSSLGISKVRGDVGLSEFALFHDPSLLAHLHFSSKQLGSRFGTAASLAKVIDWILFATPTRCFNIFPRNLKPILRSIAVSSGIAMGTIS